MALVDVIAPPDFILNSPIGSADGEVSDLVLLNTQLGKHTHTHMHAEFSCLSVTAVLEETVQQRNL